jgi:hypothetical protein
MFRAEILWFANGPTLKMKGSLVGEWAEHASCLVTTNVLPKGLIVDLTEINYIDFAGERLLSWLSSVGARFVARSAYAISLCKRLGFSPVRRIPARRHRGKDEKPSIAQSHAG